MQNYSAVSIRHSVVLALSITLLFGLFYAQENSTEFNVSAFNVFFAENSSSNQSFDYYLFENDTNSSQVETIAVFVNIDELNNNETELGKSSILPIQSSNSKELLQISAFGKNCVSEQADSVFFDIHSIFFENGTLNQSSLELMSDECYLKYFLDSSLAKSFGESDDFFSIFKELSVDSGIESQLNASNLTLPYSLPESLDFIYDLAKSIFEIKKQAVYPNNKDFSVEIWAKTNDISDAIIATSGEYSASKKSYWTIAKSKAGNEAIISVKLNPGNGEIKYYGKKNIADGNWHHIAVIMKPGQKKLNLYLDGQLELERQCEFFAFSEDFDIITIGNSDASQNEWFIGNIYGLETHNFAITEMQLAQQYEKGKAFLEGTK